VLQFFPHELHPDFIRRRRREIADHTGSKNVLAYDARTVCYFLAAHEDHLGAIEATNRAIEQDETNTQIHMIPH